MNANVMVQPMTAKYGEAPPALAHAPRSGLSRPAYPAAPPASAHDPSDGLTTPPIRPNATAVPTPVERIDVGYTCAASAYIVVCTALIRPPVHASIANTWNVFCGPTCIVASTTAPAMAAADIPSIERREPRRTISAAPSTAPTTPPKLKAVRP